MCDMFDCLFFKCNKPGLTSQVAAIANNSDFRLGVLKSSRMNTGKSRNCPIVSGTHIVLWPIFQLIEQDNVLIKHLS